MLQTLPIIKDLVNYFQSFYFELIDNSTYIKEFEEYIKIEIEEYGVFNDNIQDNKQQQAVLGNRIGCSMPPYHEPNIPRTYMYVNSNICEVNSTSDQIYLEYTNWQIFEDRFYDIFYKNFTGECNG